MAPQIKAVKLEIIARPIKVGVRHIHAYAFTRATERHVHGRCGGIAEQIQHAFTMRHVTEHLANRAVV